MNNKLENNIKKQLENREIPVSENAWEKLSGMMQENPAPRKIKPWVWIGVAASLAVIFGIIFGLNSLDLNPKAQIGNSTDLVLQEIDNQSIKNSSQEKERNQNPIGHSIQNKEIKYSDKLPPTEIVKSPKKEIPVEMENERQIFEEKIKKFAEQKSEQKEEPLIALTTDSVSKPAKKPSYVDPEMLLYSIENNQAVQQKNSDSRLVLIDFNK